MWTVSPITATPFLFFSRPSTPPLRPFFQTLSRAVPPINDGDVSDDDIGGLGHTLLANLNSSSNNSSSNPRRQKKKQGDGKQLSGSDVLWALQRAAAKKKKKNKKRREVSSSADTRTEDDDADLSNIKPLRIKTEWAAKLDDLEKRLQELSQLN